MKGVEKRVQGVGLGLRGSKRGEKPYDQVLPRLRKRFRISETLIGGCESWLRSEAARAGCSNSGRSGKPVAKGFRVQGCLSRSASIYCKHGQASQALQSVNPGPNLALSL